MVVYNSKGPNKMMKENQCYCFTSVHLKSPYNNVLTVHHCFQEKKIVKSSRERKKNSTLDFQNFLAVVLIIIHARKSINAMKKWANGNLQTDMAEINTRYCEVRLQKCTT